ncbi:MAG: isochorismatase family protein [Alphaproteobacteria bacterium]
MTEYAVVPERMALVNVDMQVAFVEGTPLSAPGGVALLEPVNKLIKACRAAGVKVIHTRHTTRADGSNLGTMGELIEPVRAGYIKEGQL